MNISRKYFFLGSLIALILFFLTTTFVFSQQKDAVGVRILPNPNHMPVQLWYEEQDFPKGSPQPVIVDGYDGIKDGRTIYVNAINVINAQIKAPFYCKKNASSDLVSCDDPDADINTKKNNFYTNVYVISHSGMKDDTGEIFKQITDNWRFNKNITDPIERENLRKDARRLADLAYLQTVLEKYRTARGKYPILKSGTYLEGATMSKWPSWQANLGRDLGIELPADPENIFYPDKCPANKVDCYCQGYDAKTCWDDVARLFNGKRTIKEGLSNENNFSYTDEEGKSKTANLKNALVYYYNSIGNGSSYELGASNWETPYIGQNYINELQSDHSAGNTKPAVMPCDKLNIGRAEAKIAEISAFDSDKFTGKLQWELTDIKGIDGNPETSCSINKTSLKITSTNGNCCLKEVELLPNGNKSDGMYGDKYISFRKIKVTSNDIANPCEAKIMVKVADDGIKNVPNSILESDVYNMGALVKKAPANILGTSRNFGVIDYPYKSQISGSEKDLTYTWAVDSGEGCLNDLVLADGKIGGLSLNKNIIEGTPTEEGQYCIKISAAGANDFHAKIKILNNPPKILSAAKADAIPGKAWQFDVDAYDNVRYPELENKEYPHLPIQFKFNFFDKPSWIGPADILAGGFVEGVSGDHGVYTKTLTGTPNESGTGLIHAYDFNIIVKDNKGRETSQAFKLNVVNHAPKITKWPQALIKRDIESFSIKIEAEDEDEQILHYSVAINPIEGALPRTMLEINAEGALSPVGGHLLPSDAGMYNVTVTVSDGYGGQDKRIFPLTINTYCGDSVLQKPNMEGVGGLNEDGNESCDMNVGIASSPADSSKSKQYACSDKCTPTGGWCGNGVLQNGENGTKNYGEKCEGTQGIAKEPEESSVEKQYACTGECSPTGGYCGDGIVNGKEICDGNTRVCSAKLAVGLPAHCDGALFQGTQACNSTCTAWADCVIPPPTIVSNSSTACANTSPVMNDYACCELTGCSQDGCACCGRGEAGASAGYIVKQSKSVSWDPSQSLDAGYLNGDGSNKYISCGDLGSAGNSPTNACKLTLKEANNRDWQITTNHSTARFRCWR